MDVNGIKVTDLSKVQIPFGNELHLVSSFIGANGENLSVPESRSVELRKVAGFSNLIHSSLNYSVGFNTDEVPEVTNFSLYNGGILDLDEKINHFIFDVPYKNELCFNFMIQYVVTVIYGNGYTANFKGNHTYIEINGKLLRQFTTDTTDLDSTYPPYMFGNQIHGNELFLYRIPYANPDQYGQFESGRRFKVYWKGMPSGAIGGATVTISLTYSANVTDSKILCGYDSARLYGFDSFGNLIDADSNGLLALDSTDPLTLTVLGNFLNASDSTPKISVTYDTSDLNGNVSLIDISPTYSPNLRNYSIGLLPPDGGQYSDISGTLRIQFTYDCGGEPPTVKNYEIAINQAGNGGTGTETSTASPTPTSGSVLQPIWYSTGTANKVEELPIGFGPIEDIIAAEPNEYGVTLKYPNSTLNAVVYANTVSGDPVDVPVVVYRTPQTFTVVFKPNWYGYGNIELNIIDDNLEQADSGYQYVSFEILQPSGS